MMQQVGNYFYVLGDGDKIRERIEGRLLSGDLDAAAVLSRQLTEAVLRMRDAAITQMDADIIIVGGDDLLFTVEDKNYRREHIDSLAQSFYDLTGGTCSFGVGRSFEKAYLNLRRAKASKKFSEKPENAMNGIHATCSFLKPFIMYDGMIGRLALARGQAYRVVFADSEDLYRDSASGSFSERF